MPSSGRQHGAAAVEMALILPLLLALLFGIIEFARYTSTEHGVSTAAREAARFAIATGGSPPQYADCTGIQAAASQRSGIAYVTAGDVTVQYLDAGGAAVADCATNTASEIQDAVDDGHRVEVTVTRPFDALTFIDFFPATITRMDDRTIFLQSP